MLLLYGLGFVLSSSLEKKKYLQLSDIILSCCLGMFPQHNKKSHSDESVMMIVNSSIPSSSSSTLQFSQLEDDDVTEKYLTNSSKKFKVS